MVDNFGIEFTPGEDLYVVFWNQIEVLRQASGGWVAKTGGVLDVWPLAEYSIGRTDVADYRLQTPYADLSRMCAGIADGRGIDVVARYYKKVGADYDTTTDTILHSDPFLVCFGQRGPATMPPLLDFVVVPGYRKDLDPKVASFWVQITANGVPVDLSAVSGSHYVTVTVRKENEGADLFTATSSTVDAGGRILVTHDTPGYVIDRSYWCTVEYKTSAMGSTLLKRVKPFLGA